MTATFTDVAAPGSASRRRPARRVLFDLLSRIEREAPTGHVHVGLPTGEVLGHAMVAGGRLCYAASAAGHEPIGRILARTNPLIDLYLEQAALEARQRGVRLCEVLLERPGVELERIRDGLRSQTASALLAISHGAVASELALDLTPARDNYDHRLTFTPLDIFLTASAALDVAPADRAQQLFAEYAACADAALLLVRPPTAGALPLPVAARGLEESSLLEVVTISRAVAVMARPRGFAAAAVEPRVMVFAGPHGIWVCANGRQRIALIRTGPSLKAGQIVGFALHLARLGEGSAG